MAADKPADGYVVPDKPEWLSKRRYVDGPHGPVIAEPATGDRKSSPAADDAKRGPDVDDAKVVASRTVKGK